MDDDEGFVDFTKPVGSRASGSIAGRTSSSGGRSLKQMLGGKFKNRMSVIRRDSVRRDTLKRNSIVGGGPSGGMEEIKEDGDNDEFDKILEDVEDFESTALHHNYDMINIREREETEPSPYRTPCI